MRTVTTIALLMASVVAGALVMEKQGRAGDAESYRQQLSIWQAKYAEASSRAVRVADTVRVTEYRTRTLRDSVLVNLTDTVAVKEYIYQTDTLRVACLLCAAMLDTLRLSADSVQRAYTDLYEATRPKWWHRCGLALGWGITKVGSDVKAGPVVGAMCRAWP